MGHKSLVSFSPSILLLALFFCLPTQAAVYPQQDLNGYISKYDEPLIDSGAGDTCRAGRTCHDFDLVTCDQNITTADGNWNKITNNQSDRFFCVKQGDYRSFGNLTVSTNGTSGARKWIICTDTSNDIRPHFEPWDNTSNSCRTNDTFTFDGNYWGVTHFWFDGENARGSRPAIYVGSNAVGTIISNNLIKRYAGNTGSDSSATIDLREDSSQTLIQYNIIEDPLTAENNELAGVRLVEVDENIIVNNIIRNHSSQIKFFGVGSGCPDSACGNFIENNDLYNEDSMRTDCNGNYTPSGDCTATESIMSSKVSGGSAVDEWNTVIRNRMRNARGADTDVCCLGGGSGSCISISNEGSGSSNRTEYMLIRHNYCSEVEIGLKQPRSGSGDRISMIGNIFHDLVPGSPSSQPAVRLNWCVDCEAYFNLMIDTPSSFQSGGGEDAAGNMIINVPNFIDSGSSGDWSYNAYYESQDDPYSSPEIDLPTRESSDNAQFCIWLNLLDSPEQVCMDEALTTTNSPHHEWSNFSPLSGHGVNNASVGSYPLDIDWFEVVRSNPTSAGPFIESEAEQQLKLISSGKNRGFDKGFNRGYQ